MREREREMMEVESFVFYLRTTTIKMEKKKSLEEFMKKQVTCKVYNWSCHN